MVINKSIIVVGLLISSLAWADHDSWLKDLENGEPTHKHTTQSCPTSKLLTYIPVNLDYDPLPADGESHFVGNGTR